MIQEAGRCALAQEEASSLEPIKAHSRLPSMLKSKCNPAGCMHIEFTKQGSAIPWIRGFSNSQNFTWQRLSNAFVSASRTSRRYDTCEALPWAMPSASVPILKQNRVNAPNITSGSPCSIARSSHSRYDTSALDAPFLHGDIVALPVSVCTGGGSNPGRDVHANNPLMWSRLGMSLGTNFQICSATMAVQDATFAHQQCCLCRCDHS